MFCPGPSDSSGSGGHTEAPLCVLTIDVEEYFHTSVFRQAEGRDPRHTGHDAGAERWVPGSRLAEPLKWLLEVLDSGRQRATFFWLGEVARADPWLVKEAASRGHEIGCHGYSHRSVKGMDPAAFRDEVLRARQVIGEACGQAPVGYRAPDFSLGPEDRRLHEILRDLGFKYDSSVCPTFLAGREHSRATRRPWEILPGLWELPLAVSAWGPLRVPLGGVFARVLPHRVTGLVARKTEKDGIPAVLYFHPWEFDPGQPRALGLGPVGRARQYWGLAGNRARFTKICAGLRFTTALDTVRLWTSKDSSSGLPHV